MSERNEKRIINAVFAVLAVVIIVFAVDIEIKLTKLMKSEAMVVNTNAETTQVTTVDVYSFHNQLTAENTTTTQILSTTALTEITTSEYATTIIINNDTIPYTQVTTTESTTQYIQPSDTTTVTTTEPTTEIAPSIIWSVDGDPNFYRTLTGEKYHKADCPYVKNSRILVTVEEIIDEGYEPCLKCMKGE